jgi:hypothetical protein
MRHITSHLPYHPDFTLWTGDNARHDGDPFLPRLGQEVFDENKRVAMEMETALGTDTVIPNIGNNDVPVHDCISAGPNYVLGNLSEIWSPFLSQGEQDTFLEGGYFSRLINPKIRVISINTMYWFADNPLAPDCNETGSPGGLQVNWMEGILSESRAQGQVVYIAGHVPPMQWQPACVAAYTSMTERYSDLIKLHAYGHYHSDLFTMVLAEDTTPVGTILVSPSLVPSHNPTMRLFSYDNETGEILNYEQYYVDLDTTYYGAVKWLTEYDPISAYGLPDMSPASWNVLANEIKLEPQGLKSLLYQKYLAVSAASAGAHYERRASRVDPAVLFEPIPFEE